MRFGPVPLNDAEGSILAQSLTLPGGRIAKGALLEAAHLDLIRAGGLSHVTVARLESGDLHEDAAADRLAGAIMAGPGLVAGVAATGRVNLRATGPGIVILDAPAIHAANLVNPMITIATVPPFQRMGARGLVATIKIIAYGVPGRDVTAAATSAQGAIRFAAPIHASATLIETRIAAVPSDKGRRALKTRLDRLGIALTPRVVVAHQAQPIADALRAAPGRMLFILTASATSDMADTAPEGVRAAGGAVMHFGMPVDPGNLLFLGAMGDRPVIGLPGCARSPALNGADWVLERVACGIAVTPGDIAAMGVGGLLKEIPSRPAPRDRVRGMPDL
jgi:molybdenum cofactor cytidylyltransferase